MFGFSFLARGSGCLINVIFFTNPFRNRSKSSKFEKLVPNPFRKMATQRLYIDEKKKTKKGKVAIYCLVHIQNKTLKINTGVSVLIEKFDQEKQRIIGNTKEDKDNNLIIDNCLSRINQISVRYRLQERILTADLLLREYKNPTHYIDFFAWLEKKINERVKNKEIGAISGKHHKVLLNKLKRYKKELSFAEIDLKFLSMFRAWLSGPENKNSVNTIQKAFGYFSAYMNIALREEILSVNPLELLHLKRIDVQIVYLTESELNKLVLLYQKNRFQDNYHKTLRHFLFMCLTGVRISDLKRIKAENIQDGILKIIPYKTRAQKQKEIHLPLVDLAKKLIEDEPPTKSGYLFDLYSDQKMNTYLKKIAENSGIPKKIRNHAGRHTFATLFLDKTSDVATLQRLLGHSNISETMKYVHISTRKIEFQMANFNELLFKSLEGNKKPGD
jgi:integrase